MEALIARILGFNASPLPSPRIKPSPRFIPTWYGARNGRHHPPVLGEGLTTDERRDVERAEEAQRIARDVLRDVLRWRARGQG